MEFSLISLKALIKIFGKIYFQRLVMLSSCFYDVGLFVEGCLFDWKYLQRVDFHAYKRLRIIRNLYGY